MTELNILFRLKRKLDYIKNSDYNRRKLKLINRIKNERKLIILGNQKTGSTAIAALIAERSGQTAMLDIKDALQDASWQIAHKYKVAEFSDFIFKYRADFEKKILKEPSLTFFTEELFQYFPNSDYLFIARNPFDNIRSILNRLNIPGNLSDIVFSDWEELKNYPTWRLALNSMWLGEPKGNYIEALAYRWNVASSVYIKHQQKMLLLRYEDFKADKVGSVDSVCEYFNFQIVNDISKLKDHQYQGKGMNQADPIDFFGTDNFEKIRNICATNATELGYQI